MEGPKFTDNDKHVFITAGQGTNFSFTIINSGKTPAMNYQAVIASTILPTTEKFVPKYTRPETLPTVGVLFPQVKATLVTRPSSGKAEQWQIDALNRGEYVFYIFAKIRYVSIGIKGSHFQRFGGSQWSPELVPAHTTA